MKLKDKIVRDINVPTKLVEKALAYAYIRFRYVKIKKRNGDYRLAIQPARRLKLVQHWLINNVFSKIQLHDAAMAYRERRSIKNNAMSHRKGKYFVKLDFKDFFPSITYSDLMPYMHDWHNANNPEWVLDEEAGNIIARACFDKTQRLPIGYPSSPIISNIVMFKFDDTLSKAFTNVERFGHVVYTRYADDIVLSTDKKDISGAIYKMVEAVVTDTKSPKLTINTEKTKFSSSSGGSALLTGLRICNDGHITVHRAYKKHVRLLLSLLQQKKLSREPPPTLKGHINYLKHVDTNFYKKLLRKYPQAIKMLFDE